MRSLLEGLGLAQREPGARTPRPAAQPQPRPCAQPRSAPRCLRGLRGRGRRSRGVRLPGALRSVPEPRSSRCREAPAGPPGRGAPPLPCPGRTEPCPGAARPRPAVQPPGEAVAPPKRARGRRGRCSALPARAGPCHGLCPGPGWAEACPVSMSHVPCPVSRRAPCPAVPRVPCSVSRVVSHPVSCRVPCRAVPVPGRAPCPVSHIPCRDTSRVVPCPVPSRAGPCRARCCPVPGRGRTRCALRKARGRARGSTKAPRGAGVARVAP